MKLLSRIIHAMVILSSLSGVVASGEHASPQIDFMREIRPILSQNCFSCHGPDENTREAGLRLDQRKTALAELDSGEHAIVPEKPQQSELYIRLVSEDPHERMPPGDSSRALTAEQVETVRRWIEQGAAYEDHWAFQPPQRPPLPEVRDPAWPRNEIDYFVLAQLERMGIAPSREADRATLIRRLSLDLLGLPPTIAEVEQFIDDDHPEAYLRLVQRMLASAHFGERWGKHWLDLARYADSDGYLGDTLRPYAYLYRDWVIDAINRDLPLDQFTIEQLAGDLLPEATLSQKIATGFHRNVMKNTEAGADREEDRINRMVNYVSTTGTVWLGLTIGCAECHTHKFDPISHQEFFQLYSFFNNTEELDLPAATPAEAAQYERAVEQWTALVNRRQQDVQLALIQNSDDCGEKTAKNANLKVIERLEAIFSILAKPEAQRKDADKKTLALFRESLDADVQERLADYEKQALAKPAAPSTKAATIAELAASKRRATRIHLRGDFRNPGDEVQPGTLGVLHPLQSRGEHPDRLDLARWLVDPANPLMHRTSVNHIWKHLLGRGLVSTTDNFGTTGEPPSHPELLDWLALELVEHSWSRKAIIAKIVQSATYRQASHLRPDLRELDPHNVWLARQSRFRLEAEVVRDSALAVGGLLNLKIGGPSIRPPLDPQVTAFSRNKDWPVSPGAEQYRRGSYILFRRSTPFSMLLTFDAPDTSVSCTQRERTNSPLQALTLLNDPVFHECAQQLGRHTDWDSDGRPAIWIRKAFKRCLARDPSDAEVERLISLYHDQYAMLADLPADELKSLVGEPLADADLREQAARVMVARSLINVHEFITRE
jgi:hypothetical protein